MTKKDIWELLDKLYMDKKPKKFIDHLIKAYFPKDNIEKIFKHPKGRFRCGITNLSLVAIDDVYNEIAGNTDLKNEFTKFIDSMFNDAPADSPKIEILNRKSVAITGKNTDTFLRYETFIAFHTWLEHKIIDGDKHIFWLIKQVQADSDFKCIKKSEKSEKTKNKLSNPTTRPTLADLGVLNQLKNKK